MTIGPLLPELENDEAGGDQHFPEKVRRLRAAYGWSDRPAEQISGYRHYQLRAASHLLRARLGLDEPDAFPAYVFVWCETEDHSARYRLGEIAHSDLLLDRLGANRQTTLEVELLDPATDPPLVVRPLKGCFVPAHGAEEFEDYLIALADTGTSKSASGEKEIRSRFGSR